MADVKLSELPAASAVTTDDLFEISNDPAGTPVSQKATAAQLLAFIIANQDADLTDLLARWTVASGIGPASLDFAEDTDNGTERLRVIAPAAITTSVDLQLPGPTANDVLLSRTSTATVTNKTLTLGTNTITGTKAQLDTAVTDGNIVYVGDAIDGAAISTGTVADARIASTIARDSEVTTAISTSEAGQVRDGDAAGGDLAGTYPNPTVSDDSHQHSISTGGTGQSTATAAFDALSPTTALGDTIYNDGTNDVRLAVGAEGDIKQVVSGVPAWVTPTPLSALGATAGLDTDDTIIVVEDGLPKQATLANITALDADDTYLVVEDGQIHQATRDQSTLWAGTRRLLHASAAGDIVVSGVTSLMNGSYDIAANYLAVGDILELEAFGVWLNNTGANQGMTVNWTIDGTGPSGAQLATGGAITTSASAHSWMLNIRWRIQALGSGLVAVMTVEKTLGAIGATNDTQTQTSQGVLVGSFDTTQVNTIDCSSTQTATNAQLKMTPHACTIWHSRPLDT